MHKLKVGFVPEHFSTPLHFAQVHGFFRAHNLEVELVPFLAGSGHLIQSLGSKSIDVAVGLTEAFVRGLAQGNTSYHIAGTYVESPLRWAISTGAKRSDVSRIPDLQDARIGVSRIGSGSYVMSFVLGLQHKFKAPFFREFPICLTFENLRNGVNLKNEEYASEAFMWEYFTSKRYYDSGEIKHIGDLYTPWPSWVISTLSSLDAEVRKSFLDAVNEGIAYFNSHKDEAVKYISLNLDYSEEDASEWLKTVKFSDDVEAVNWAATVEKTVEVLKVAGVIEGDNVKETVEKGIVGKRI